MVRPASAGAYLFTLAIGFVVGFATASVKSAGAGVTAARPSASQQQSTVSADTASATYRADMDRISRARTRDPYRWVVIAVDSLPTGASTVSVDRRTLIATGRLVQAWLRYSYTLPEYRPGFVLDERMEIDCGSDAWRLLYYDRVPNLGHPDKAGEPTIYNAPASAPMYYTPPIVAHQQESICALAGLR